MTEATPGKRIMALDFGRKRIGVAVSDTLQLIAHGRATLHYRSQAELYERLRSLVACEDVAMIVVGMPLNMDGSAGEMSEAVRTFMARLENRLQLPVRAWDERLTSRQAERALQAAGRRPHKKKEVIDRLAAVFILQSFLDSMASTKNIAQS